MDMRLNSTKSSADMAEQYTMSDLAKALSLDLAVHLNTSIYLDAKVPSIDFNLVRLRASNRTNARLTELVDVEGLFSSIAIQLPDFEPAALLWHELLEAGRKLYPNGTVALFESHRARIKRAEKAVAKAFKSTRTLIATDGAIVVGSVLRDFDQSLVPQRAVQLPMVDGRQFALQTWPGLFSGDAIDPGTLLLMEALPELQSQKVLDVGCGYGPLSLYAAALGAEVMYADADLRALRTTRNNLLAAGFTGTAVATVDLAEVPSDLLDVVVSNPPTHAGSEVLRKLFRGMARVVKTKSSIFVVLREHLNYEKWLSEVGAVDRILERDGYKILRIQRLK